MFFFFCTTLHLKMQSTTNQRGLNRTELAQPRAPQHMPNSTMHNHLIAVKWGGNKKTYNNATLKKEYMNQAKL